MATRVFDVAIIGAGTAGMAAYEAANRHGVRVALIESDAYGTLCARHGCMPSKLLIAAADVAHQARMARRFGVHADLMRVDGEAVMGRVHAERRLFVNHNVEHVWQWPVTTRFKGRARFIDRHRLQVGEDTLSASRFIIATGSEPIVPAAWREALGNRLVTSDDVLDWTSLPHSLAIIGAGTVGLELGQALSRLGVRVMLLNRGAHVGQLTDPIVQSKAVELLSRQMDMQLSAQILKLGTDGRRVTLTYHVREREQRTHVEQVLVAIGRRPVLGDLNLAAAGIMLDPDGNLMPESAFDPATGRIGQSHIFIAGDAAGGRGIQHEAALGGRIAGDNAGRWPDVQPHRLPAPLSVVFTDPQMMLAGQTFQDLQDRSATVAYGTASFDNQGRSRIMDRLGGVIRLYADRRDHTLLGAEMVGPGAEHVGHLMAWAVQHRLTVQQVRESPFYHPTLEEGIRPALAELARMLTGSRSESGFSSVSFAPRRAA